MEVRGSSCEQKSNSMFQHRFTSTLLPLCLVFYLLRRCRHLTCAYMIREDFEVRPLLSDLILPYTKRISFFLSILKKRHGQVLRKRFLFVGCGSGLGLFA